MGGDRDACARAADLDTPVTFFQLELIPSSGDTWMDPRVWHSQLCSLQAVVAPLGC